MSVYKRELIINVSFLIFINLLIKPYYIFFVERNVQNEAGTAAWGVYFTLFSLSMIPQIVLDMGFASYINQRLSTHRDQYRELINETVWVKPVLAFLFSGIYLFIAWIGGYLYEYKSLVGWIMINQILISGILFSRAYVSGLGHYRWDSILSVSDKLIFIVLFTWGVYLSNSISILHFLRIQFVSLIIPLLGVGGWIIWTTRMSFASIEMNKIKSTIRQSLPYAGIFILMVLYCRMEPVWIDALRKDGALQAGIYASAYRLLDAANMMGFLFAGLLLPMFAHAMTHSDSHEYQSIFDLAGRVMVSASIIVSISILSQHRYIMTLLYRDTLPDILNVVIINLIPLTLNYLFSTLLTAAGKARDMNRYFLVSILINILSHLLLTPKYGAVGAAYAALLTQSVTSILLFQLIQKNHLIRFTIGHFISFASSIIIILILAYIIDLIHISPVFKIAFLSIGGTAGLMMIGMMPIGSIISILKRRTIEM